MCECGSQDRKETISVLRDTGNRTDLGTGAMKDVSLKENGDFSLLSPFSQFRLARHFAAGAMKYSARNWEKGIPFSRFIDSALRHITKYQLGWRDEDHLAAALWNIHCLIHTEEMVRVGALPVTLSDLPVYGVNSIEEGE